MVVKTTWADNIKASTPEAFHKKREPNWFPFILSTDLTELLFLFVLSFFISFE